MQIIPFAVDWSATDVGAVLARVKAYPFQAAAAFAPGWDYGCDGEYLRKFTDYWTEEYDWRDTVATLNRYPQFLAKVEDIELHFVHVVGEARGRRPLLLSHGWPGSHYEFWAVIDRLAFPSRFGGSPMDAFDLVIPSLPGFGFSSKPGRPLDQRTTARLFNTLMTRVLGYDQYVAQGGDFGAIVTSWLGHDCGAHVRAIHLNMIAFRPPGGVQTEQESAWVARNLITAQKSGAYMHLQTSKPQSVAWLGTGNPVGQAAWMLERFHDWSDLTVRAFEEVYSMTELLTNVMIYVMTDSFGTGASYYRTLPEEGGFGPPGGLQCETPTAFACFPNSLYKFPPRSWAERAYNIIRWSDMPRGGHFPSMEETDLFVTDVVAWGRNLS